MTCRNDFLRVLTSTDMGEKIVSKKYRKSRILRLIFCNEKHSTEIVHVLNWSHQKSSLDLPPLWLIMTKWLLLTFPPVTVWISRKNPPPKSKRKTLSKNMPRICRYFRNWAKSIVSDFLTSKHNYNHFEISETWRKRLLQKSEYKLFRWDLLVKCSKVSILSIKKA